VGQGLRMRKHLFTNQFFLKWCSLITPLGFIAVLAGWYTTETGRQPWVVYGLLRTQDAASILPASSVLISLIAFAALYSTLLATFIFYVCRLIRQEPHATHLPRNSEQLTAWLEKE
jgi:cytochrome d ubiquinol oxidase subunit I